VKQERIDELVKAAKERVNGPPGSRGITLLPEEVLELLDTGLVVEARTTAAAAPTTTPTVASAGGPWDAIGRIASAFIAKQPPNVKATKVADYVADVIRDVRQKAEL
jgi:hypothetical protein